MDAPWNFNIHPQKTKFENMYFWMCHTKKHVGLDKHKHMTMKFFALSHERFPNHFFVLSSFGWWEQNHNKPFGPPWWGFQVWWWDTWKQIREVEWCCWTDENLTRNDSINLPSDYSNMAMETWQWKLDHLKMYFAVTMLLFKPSMLGYRTLQGKLWCKNALLIIVLNQQGGWSAESVRWF